MRLRLSLLLMVCFFSLSTNGFSQSQEEKQRQERLEEAEERKNEYIKDFVGTLEVDEFQKVIITNTMNSYFDEVNKIIKYEIPSYQKKTLIEELDAVHFNDLKTIVSEDVYVKVKEGVKMENYKENQKNIKKSKKRKKNKRQAP